MDQSLADLVVAGTVLSDGRLVIATQEGNLFLSVDEGANFEPLPVEDPKPVSDLLEGRPGELIMSGSFGIRVQRLPAAVVETLKLKEGDEIEIHVAGKREFEVAKRPGARELLARLRKFRGRLPADFKFDRLEANEGR